MVGAAFKYVTDSVPDALKKFGIDPNTVEGQKRILEMLETRLDSRVFDYAKEEGEVEDLKVVKDKEDEPA